MLEKRCINCKHHDGDECDVLVPMWVCTCQDRELSKYTNASDCDCYEQQDDEEEVL